MSLGLIGGGENTSRLNNVVGTGLRPRDVGRILFHVELDSLSIDNEAISGSLDFSLEVAVSAVILEHVFLFLPCISPGHVDEMVM